MGKRPPTAAQRDLNEPKIVKILEAHGIQVHLIDLPCDAMVNFKGWTYLVEIKNGPKAKLSKTQEKFHKKWLGKIHILSTDTEAEDFAKGVRVAASAGLQYRGTIS